MAATGWQDAIWMRHFDLVPEETRKGETLHGEPVPGTLIITVRHKKTGDEADIAIIANPRGLGWRMAVEPEFRERHLGNPLVRWSLQRFLNEMAILSLGLPA